MDVLVTVVVPVYRVEKYLDRCISSIVCQTHRNLQILLIDDGSPDNCPCLCDQWAKRDSRIRVIHQQNRGLGMTRNCGIAHAEGKYICFFDSDDYLAPNTIAESCALAEKERAELVLFGFCCVSSAGKVYKKVIPDLPRRIYRGSAVQRELLPAALGEDRGVTLSAWSGLFSAELIRRAGWKFVSEREIISEDIYSLLALYRHVRKAAVLPEALYFYCENETSLSRSYQPDRYGKNKEFYQKCLALCEASGYGPKVKARCAEPFLRNTIAAMKQEAAVGIRGLRPIIDDPMLQQVLCSRRSHEEDLKKRILYLAVRRKWYAYCFFLLMAKNLQKRKTGK